MHIFSKHFTPSDHKTKSWEEENKHNISRERKFAFFVQFAAFFFLQVVPLIESGVKIFSKMYYSKFKIGYYITATTPLNSENFALFGVVRLGKSARVINRRQIFKNCA